MLLFRDIPFKFLDRRTFVQYHSSMQPAYFVEACSVLESLRWNSIRGQNQGFPQCIPSHCLSWNIATLTSASKSFDKTQNTKTVLPQCSVWYSYTIERRDVLGCKSLRTERFHGGKGNIEAVNDKSHIFNPSLQGAREFQSQQGN